MPYFDFNQGVMNLSIVVGTIGLLCMRLWHTLQYVYYLTYVTLLNVLKCIPIGQNVICLQWTKTAQIYVSEIFCTEFMTFHVLLFFDVKYILIFLLCLFRLDALVRQQFASSCFGTKPTVTSLRPPCYLREREVTRSESKKYAAAAYSTALPKLRLHK